MNKPYKITYKTFLNDRLKKVPFHNQEIYPLYLQVTYRRKTIFFKSYYFDLLALPTYSRKARSKIHSPSIEDVITLENIAINAIINILPSDYTLDKFKIAYDLYTRDLCLETELGLFAHLSIFFVDKNASSYGRMLMGSRGKVILYDVMVAMKKFFIPEIYQELVKSAIHGGQPYLQLYAFVAMTKKWPLQILSIVEWDTGDTKEKFKKFLLDSYNEEESSQIVMSVEKLVNELKKAN